MRRPHYLALGLAGYLASFASMVYFGLFLANLVVPKGIDSGPEVGDLPAALVDLALLVAFGLVHSLLARRPIKVFLAEVLPPALERSLFSLIAGLQIGLLCWAWQPLPETVLAVPAGWPALELTLWVLQGVGWSIVIAALATIGSTHLFGLQQAWSAARGLAYAPPPLTSRGLYRWVRHPVYSGSLLAFWATPTMSEGRLLLVAGLTIYLFVGLAFEERDLEREHGDAYREHRRRVPALVPLRLK